MKNQMVTIRKLIEEMLEFGISLETAELLAPSLARLENDPRGFALAILDESPEIAEKCGLIRRH